MAAQKYQRTVGSPSTSWASCTYYYCFKMNWGDSNIEKLIQVYSDNSFLFDIADADYHNRVKRRWDLGRGVGNNRYCHWPYTNQVYICVCGWLLVLVGVMFLSSVILGVCLNIFIRHVCFWYQKFCFQFHLVRKTGTGFLVPVFGTGFWCVCHWH